MRWVWGGMLAAVLMIESGCAMQRPSWNKPWGRGAAIGALACCPAGAGLGVWIQDERRGTSRAKIVNPDTGEVITVKEKDDAQYWKGAIIGCAVGIPVCGLIGHVFFDEQPVVAPPPPSPTGEQLPPGGVGAPQPKRRIVLRGVYFDFDRADIRPDSKPVLDEAAVILTEHKADIDLLIVEGHTDSLGTDEYNQALSLRRAEAVYRYLVNAGVAPEIMRIEGFGESRPVADNATEAGRAQNRRVELRVSP